MISKYGHYGMKEVTFRLRKPRNFWIKWFSTSNLFTTGCSSHVLRSSIVSKTFYFFRDSFAVIPLRVSHFGFWGKYSLPLHFTRSISLVRKRSTWKSFCIKILIWYQAYIKAHKRVEAVFICLEAFPRIFFFRVKKKNQISPLNIFRT